MKIFKTPFDQSAVIILFLEPAHVFFMLNTDFKGTLLSMDDISLYFLI